MKKLSRGARKYMNMVNWVTGVACQHKSDCYHSWNPVQRWMDSTVVQHKIRKTCAVLCYECMRLHADEYPESDWTWSRQGAEIQDFVRGLGPATGGQQALASANTLGI